MKLNDMFVHSNYSIEDLEMFRDTDGFIDLTRTGIEFTDESREIIGNADRIKNWVNFNGKKVLIKGEAILDEERNYGIYGELIAEEIAKKLGVETAHYDLIKMTDEDGKTIFGVFSESVVDLEGGERMESLHSIIGDESQEDNEFEDVTNYEYTIKRLKEQLILDGICEKQVEEVITEYKKRLAFGIAVADTDKHTENIAFIRKKVDGKETIRLSPNFDSESILMLDMDLTTIDKILGDIDVLRESVNFADPRIGILKRKEEGGFNSLWMDTLDALCEDDEVFDYYSDVLSELIDMDEIFANIEKRIGTQLPDNVKLLSKYAYESRNKRMQEVIYGKAKESDDEVDRESLKDSLIKNGISGVLRLSELIGIGIQMEKDIQEINNGDRSNGEDELILNDDDDELILIEEDEF